MKHDSIDWSQLWYPGPTRVFSDADLARAGNERPSRTLAMVALLNLLLLAEILLQMAPSRATALLTGLMAALMLAAFQGALALWRRPTRRRLAVLGIGYALAALAVALLLRRTLVDADVARWAFGICWGACAGVTVGWWFLAVYRAHQIEGRLRELAEHERAVALAGQLTAAQIQPHFLFNSLATLQHWVQTKDDRAAPMLASLTGFLRATLPLFNRPQLALGEELEAVRRYLEVMQARLGDRLRFRIELPAVLLPLALPPGLLLTLVENAVEHGVQGSLAGADVVLAGRLERQQVVLEVADSGPGPADGHADGVGLANSRARLQQAWGTQASLVLAARPGGGACATVTLPRRALDNPGTA
jgi:hypothetical protein